MRSLLPLLLLLPVPVRAEGRHAIVTTDQQSSFLPASGAVDRPSLNPTAPSITQSVPAIATHVALGVRPYAGSPWRLVAEPGDKNFDDQPATAEVPQRGSEWAAYLPGRWRTAADRDCRHSGYGLISAGPGTLRFEWRLPGGGVNVAVERIDAVAGTTVQTTVLRDAGTITPRWVTVSATSSGLTPGRP